MPEEQDDPTSTTRARERTKRLLDTKQDAFQQIKNLSKGAKTRLIMGRKTLQPEIYSEPPSMALYFRDIADSKKGLSSEREAELAKRIREGDRKARDTLVKANLRFVVSVARGYQNQGLSLADLINEGNLGLVRAASRFDEDEKKNFRFISYAVWWIRQAILQALAENSRVVKVPLNRVSQIYKLRKARGELEQKHHKAPTHEELQEAMELDNPGDLLRLQLVDTNPVALDAPIGETSNGSMVDTLVAKGTDNPDHFMIQHFLKKEAKDILGLLNERDRDILERCYGFNGHHVHTLEEVGLVYNITRERTRQLKVRALQRLKSTLVSEPEREEAPAEKTEFFNRALV